MALIIGGCFIIIIAVVMEIFRELRSFRVVHYDIQSEKLKQAKEKSKKIVFLSDLHNQCYGKGNEQLIAAIRKECPDWILIGGDMLIGKNGYDYNSALELIKKLPNICAVYYVNGNHEQRMKEYPDQYGQSYEVYKKELEKAGVRFLENRSVCMDKDGMKIHIYGFEMPKRHYGFKNVPLKTAEIVQCIGSCNRAEYNILLAHNPSYVEEYMTWGADLILSGHFHGGMVRIPWGPGVISPDLNIFPRYSGGHYKENGTDIVVSKGLGMHTIPVRLFNPAELVVITLS